MKWFPDSLIKKYVHCKTLLKYFCFKNFPIDIIFLSLSSHHPAHSVLIQKWEGFLGEAVDFQCSFWLSPSVDFILTSFQNTGNGTNFPGHGSNPSARCILCLLQGLLTGGWSRPANKQFKLSTVVPDRHFETGVGFVGTIFHPNLWQGRLSSSSFTFLKGQELRAKRIN